jgi:hypothetical protein
MRMLGSYYAFMTIVRPIIGSSGWTHLRTCGLHEQTKALVSEFAGPE